MRWILAVWFCGLTIAVPHGAGQQGAAPAGKLPVFDVVSVKPSDPGETFFMSQYTADGIHTANAPLVMVIRQAYGLMNSNNDQFLGLPGWALTERCNIDAKVGAEDVQAWKGLSREQKSQMLLSILEERFKLKAHPESRIISTYTLVIAKAGSKLKEAKAGDPYLNGIKDQAGSSAGVIRWSRGQLTAQAVGMKQLTSTLTQITGRTVVDKTGLSGNYDIALQWTPDDSAGADAAVQDAGGPSIFTAIQEQLGLRLESQKGSVDGVVIDHLERPSAN